MAWPTKNQSKTPDGKFGPAKQMKGWGDCWFLAALAAVANDQDGQKILAESIKKVNGGYDVTFKGSPDNNVFISDTELQELLKTEGGDADTRILELAADKLFQIKGNFKNLFIAIFLKIDNDQNLAEICLQDYCQRNGNQDPMYYNPMRTSGNSPTAFFLLTGMISEILKRYSSDEILKKSDVMHFLNRYLTNDRNGISVLINGEDNPLGDGRYSPDLVIAWDVIRTDITRDGRLSKKERSFLNLLDKWLETRDFNHLKALEFAAGSLNLEHINPVDFVDTLIENRVEMNQDHINLLRSGVQDVLAGGPGYIGYTSHHFGNIEGIDEAANTFAYSEPNFPTLVHTGELSNLIQAVRSGTVYLAALDPTAERDDRKLFEHAGKRSARHLREIHHQVVRDGKIDPTESGPLSNLMEMDDGALRQVYDSDKNGVIEGSELKAVQLRVDRWVEHLELTPIW